VARIIATVYITLSLPCESTKAAHSVKMRYWEIIADNLSKAGWSWGCVAAIDCNGRTIWIADAHRGDGKRFVVHQKTGASRSMTHSDPETDLRLFA
jgi:hypothetical protein